MDVRADTVNYSVSLHLYKHKDVHNVTKNCELTIFSQDVSIYDLRPSRKFCTGNKFIHIYIYDIEICKRQLKWCGECVFKQNKAFK